MQVFAIQNVLIPYKRLYVGIILKISVFKVITTMTS